MNKHITRLILTSIFVIEFLSISSCNSGGGLFATPEPATTPTLSPEQIYIAGINKALQSYNDWSNGSLKKWQDLLDNGSFNGSSYQTDIQLCAAFGPALGGCLENETLKPSLSNLIEPLNTAAKEAFIVKTKFGGLTPPAEISVAHNQVLNCLDLQISILNGMVDLIVSGKTLELQNEDSCKMTSVAIEQIQAYLDSH